MTFLQLAEGRNEKFGKRSEQKETLLKPEERKKCHFARHKNVIFLQVERRGQNDEGKHFFNKKKNENLPVGQSQSEFKTSPVV